MGAIILAVGLEDRFRVRLSERRRRPASRPSGTWSRRSYERRLTRPRSAKRPLGTRGRPAVKGPALPAPQYRTVNEALRCRGSAPTGSPSWTSRSRRRSSPFRELHERARARGRCAPGARGRTRRSGRHRAPHLADVHGRLLRRAAGRGRPGAALPAAPARAARRVPRRDGAHDGRRRSAPRARGPPDRSLLGPAVERARPPLGCRSAEDLGSGAPAGVRSRRAVDPDALALIQFSSGSTSRPQAGRAVAPPGDGAARGARGTAACPRRR